MPARLSARIITSSRIRGCASSAAPPPSGAGAAPSSTRSTSRRAITCRIPAGRWPGRERWDDEARPMFGLPAARPAADDLRRAGVPLPSFAELETPLWTFDRRFNRFAWESCADLEADPRCQIVTHATVTAIVADG